MYAIYAYIGVVWGVNGGIYSSPWSVWAYVPLHQAVNFLSMDHRHPLFSLCGNDETKQC